MKEINSVMKRSFGRFFAVAAVMLLAGTSAWAQPTLRGIITDEDGNPLAGATVVVEGTQIGATADTYGQYSITVRNGQSLLYSYLGKLSERLTFAGQTNVNVVLKEDYAAVDQVVVVGYGTQRRASITGSISQISGDELMKSFSPNVSSLLTGKVTGISSYQSSGQPGSDQTGHRIRGYMEPMYIVDGIQRSFNEIDPNEIESISILKDASATAVYGLEAAGGVMIITTKRGAVGKPVISYTGQYGISVKTNYPEFLDGPGYAYWYNKALEMDGAEPIFNKKHVEMMLNGDDSDGWANTNWFDKVFGTGTNTQHNISLSSGTENSRQFASIGYLGQKGNIKNFDYKRYNARINIENKIGNHLTVTASLAGYMADRRSPGYAAGGSNDPTLGVTTTSAPWLSILEQAAYMQPFLPMEYDGLPTATAYGSGRQPVNPVAARDLSGTQKNIRTGFQSNLSLTWNLPWVEGLSLKFTGAYDGEYTTAKNLSTPYYMNLFTLPGNDNKYQGGWTTGQVDPRLKTEYRLREQLTRWTRTTSQSSLNYANSFDRHHVTGLLLIETRDYRTNNFFAQGEGVAIKELTELEYYDWANVSEPIGGNSDRHRKAGLVFRGTYDFDHKYLVEFSGRYDGSYNFMGNVEKDRWAFFPAVSVGWRISNEEFMRNTAGIINELKIRASFGQAGSDANVAQYAYLELMELASVSQAVIGGIPVSGVKTYLEANRRLTWDVTNTVNAGFDATLWNGKLGLEFDFFYKYNFDRLQQKGDLPGSMGLDSNTKWYVNSGKIETRGVDLGVTHNNRVGSFDYGARLNFSYADSKYIFTESDNGLTPAYRRNAGARVNGYVGFIAEGLFQSEEEINNSPWKDNLRPRVGDIKYKDLNGDGVITELEDQTWIGYSPYGKYTASLNLYGSWKGLDFDLLFVGAFKRTVALTGTYSNYNQDNTQFTKLFRNNGNSPRFLVEGAWTPDNPNAEYPRLSITTPNSNNAYQSTFWLRNGNYLRLKSVQIGYTLPKAVNDFFRIGKLRVFVDGTNLFTVSKLPDGVDPEWPNVSNGYYPQQRTFTGGLSITF